MRWLTAVVGIGVLAGILPARSRGATLAVVMQPAGE